jgi:hypothetical protein
MEISKIVLESNSPIPTEIFDREIEQSGEKIQIVKTTKSSEDFSSPLLDIIYISSAIISSSVGIAQIIIWLRNIRGKSIQKLDSDKNGNNVHINVTIVLKDNNYIKVDLSKDFDDKDLTNKLNN